MSTIITPELRAMLDRGLDDVAHLVDDVPALAVVMSALRSEREAMLVVGRLQLAVMRITARTHPELARLVEAAERVFG